jgi:serine/threonine-protein kinase HipA
MTSAQVFYGDQLAGVLRRVAGGFEFSYDSDYIRQSGALPVSLTLPLRPEPFVQKSLFPFFEGLLPEGWLLRFASTALRIDPSDKFELLLRLGNDPIGAVSIRNPS